MGRSSPSLAQVPHMHTLISSQLKSQDVPANSESWTCVCAWTCVSTRVHMNVYVRFSQVLCPENSSDLNLLNYQL